MDLDFTEEHEMLREMVRGVCAEYSPLEVVRELENDEKGRENKNPDPADIQRS